MPVPEFVTELRSMVGTHPLWLPGCTAVVRLEVRVDRLSGVFVVPEVVYGNGDRAAYVDHTFACTWLAGEAYPADDECSDVRWYPRDALPELPPGMAERVAAALSDEVAARF